VLRTANPTLNVAGTHCPPVGFEHDEAEMKKIISGLTAAKPDVVFVALGSPKQEYLINRIRQMLPNAWWLGVGISFSFLCGDVRRAPRWLQQIGLEWLHRLVQDPRRLFHRYVIVGVPFGAKLMTQSLIRGIPQRLRHNRPIPDTMPFALPPAAAAQAAGTESDADRSAHAGINGNGNGNGNGSANGNGHAAAATLVDQAVALARAGVERPRLSRRAAPAVQAGSEDTPASAHVGSLARLRALVLLGGSVRSSPLIEACDRSPLDLPLDSGDTIFNHWLRQADELAQYAGIGELPVRVLVNRHAPEPNTAHPTHYGKFRVERDLSEYRGTGGVLRDLAAGYADDDLILVCNAAQILLDPLVALATALDRKEGDVTLVSHDNGTPSGVHLITCKTLRMIPDVGFVDMKEQALPLIASKYDVTVLHCRRPTGLPVRSQSDYLVALRHYHRRKLGKPALSDPLAEDWHPAFSIVEPGAIVDPRAHVHDSVVLRGAVVEAGAVVVRSIVCPGGVVKRDRPAVDQLLCPE
jgi:hypothetical protein